ncbi:MAG: hypothetical protein NWE84_05420 [Candidatus Bathyarchaeota archaeon]|nr:hypothetical protein [Candidatus Bathyarchaeota archaeon]
MFKSSKEEIRRHKKRRACSKSLSPEVVAKLKSRGLDPETVTIEQLFSDVLDEDGNDLSLMSGAEWEIMITYCKTRKYLLEKYPQSKEEAKMSGEPWEEESEEPYQINIRKAREDPQSRVFIKALFQMKTIYDKVEVLQSRASEYEKYCLRLYWHLTYNWKHAPNIVAFRGVFNDGDIFELVEAYFKICRKYHVPTFEEPYYFLDSQRRQEIKLEGDMLKRNTGYSDFEIHVSILEELK